MEVQVVTCLCLVSFYIGMYEIVLESSQASRYVLHAFAYLAVLVLVNITMSHLGGQLTEGDVNDRTAILYDKYEAYTIYRNIFILFCVKPMMLAFFKIVFLQPIVFDQILANDEWIFVAADALLDLLLFLAVLYAFRPRTPFSIFQVTEQEAGNDNRERSDR
eukprot:GHVT01062290.1.p1 GENE.GHVT01062290.1~~GHVT01062290.1.p1  ORF type:complete len:162 (-),score=0.67 GHVT01062290.1:4405-4890(-)